MLTNNVNFLWLLEFLLCDEFDAGGLGVLGEVVGGAVGAPDTLDPAVRGETLGVPAVARVVRHLVGHVLPKPQFRRVDAHFHHELLDAGHEVAQRLVRNQALNTQFWKTRFLLGKKLAYALDGVADGVLLGRSSLHLATCRVEQHFDVHYVLKFGVSLVVRITKVLDFSHREFSVL